jgi:phospholipase C
LLHPVRLAVLACVALIAAASAAGCAARAVAPAPQIAPESALVAHFAGSASPIEHVVIIIQENRSFDNLFNGFPGTDTAQSGPIHTGTIVPLTPLPLEAPYDPGHDHPSWIVSYADGAMNGFDLTARPEGVLPTANYAYVPKSEIAPYWQMAQQYTISDSMFQANTSGSFASHLYLIAAQSDLLIGAPAQHPWGCDAPPQARARQFMPNGKIGPGIFPCLSITTLADEADAAGVTWHFYTPAIGAPNDIWNTYDAIRQIRYGADWTNDVISPQTQFLNDIAGGYLANITWIVPTGSTSDHGGTKSNLGPEWVASVVNAIGASPYWKNTAIIITWDDWGGWYDHVKPKQLDIMGLGFRVPLLVVSPYARRGYVSHVPHEWGSILKFTEGVFNLPSLGQTDVRADDLSDCFSFDQPAARFRHIPTRLTPAFFVNRVDLNDPPDND